MEHPVPKLRQHTSMYANLGHIILTKEPDSAYRVRVIVTLAESPGQKKGLTQKRKKETLFKPNYP